MNLQLRARDGKMYGGLARLQPRPERTDRFSVPHTDRESISQRKLRGGRMSRPLCKVLAELIAGIAAFVDRFGDTSLP